MARIVITGASSGIGLECARAFSGLGNDVVAQYRNGRKAIEELQKEFGTQRIKGVAADLSTEEGCIKLIGEAGEFSTLVHSAGIWNDGAIAIMTRDNLETMFRVNTFSAYYLVREATKVMKQGSIVFIGSTAGERGEPGHSHYAGSKAALWGLVQSLAQELAPAIRVNLVSPGWVRTPMAEPALAQHGKLEKIVKNIPLRRIAEPQDVASAVLFLADEKQCHLTGVDLPVSGGALLPMPRG